MNRLKEMKTFGDLVGEQVSIFCRDQTHTGTVLEVTDDFIKLKTKRGSVAVNFLNIECIHKSGWRPLAWRPSRKFGCLNRFGV